MTVSENGTIKSSTRSPVTERPLSPPTLSLSSEIQSDSPAVSRKNSINATSTPPSEKHLSVKPTDQPNISTQPPIFIDIGDSMLEETQLTQDNQASNSPKEINQPAAKQDTSSPKPPISNATKVTNSPLKTSTTVAKEAPKNINTTYKIPRMVTHSQSSPSATPISPTSPTASSRLPVSSIFNTSNTSTVSPNNNTTNANSPSPAPLSLSPSSSPPSSPTSSTSPRLSLSTNNSSLAKGLPSSPSQSEFLIKKNNASTMAKSAAPNPPSTSNSPSSPTSPSSPSLPAFPSSTNLTANGNTPSSSNTTNSPGAKPPAKTFGYSSYKSPTTGNSASSVSTLSRKFNSSTSSSNLSKN